jgi:PTS system mannose-specific IID component
MIALAGGSPAVVTAAFLAAYNAVHLRLRVSGLRVGLASGLSVADGIRSMELPRWAERIRVGGVILLGLVLGLLLGGAVAKPELGFGWVAATIIFFLAGLVGGELIRRWGPELLVFLVLVGSWLAPL